MAVWLAVLAVLVWFAGPAATAQDASASTAAPATASTPSTAATTSASGPAVFSHKFHIDQGQTCDVCHDTSKERMELMPKKDVCANCHEVDRDKPSDACLKCHAMKDGKTLPFKWTLPVGMRGVKMNHQAHVTGAKLDCKTCHKGIEENEKLVASVMPKMAQCMECHQKRGPEAVSCSVCHTGEVKTVKPATHSQGNWTLLHGQEVRRGHARPVEQNCTFCHQRSFCSSCHQDTPPKNHTNQFRLRGHGLVAGIDRDKCMACHRQDFCIRCHQTTTPSSGPNAHRAGWGAPSDRHCLSCHLTNNTCSVCHKSQVSHQQAPPAPRQVPFHLDRDPSKCRNCHKPGGPGPRHVDRLDIACTQCHK